MDEHRKEQIVKDMHMNVISYNLLPFTMFGVRTIKKKKEINYFIQQRHIHLIKSGSKKGVKIVS